MTKLPVLLLVPVALLVACASPENVLVNAATTPLSDLNVVKVDIPNVLQKAKVNPYGLPEDNSCSGLTSEVSALNEALGADVDAMKSDEKTDVLQRGKDAVDNASANAVQDFAEGFIPYRGWVRKLTGAERYSKQVAKAIHAGALRRAFLKGVIATKECAMAPDPAAPNEPH